MPFIKTKNIHVTPNRSLRYICDPKKTQNGLNIMSVNCMPDARNAYLDMKQVYEYYSNRKFNEPMPKSGKAKVKLIHYIQAFDPKDNVSVETAQKIGLDLVKEMFGENVQAVIATHDDTGKIHNHIMLNVYDLKGRHFSSDKTMLNKIKRLSDKICKRYGVEPFDRENYVRKPIISGYHEWINLKRGTSWKQMIRDKIDELITVADSFDDLRSCMEQEGFKFKDGKYICVKAPSQQRNVRLKTLGDNYTPERIEKRIAEHKQAGVAIFAEQFQSVAIKINQIAGAYKNTSTLNHVNGKFMQIYQIITQEKIWSVSALQGKLSGAEKKYADLTQRVQELKEKIETTTEEIKLAEHYFNDMGVMQRRFPKKDEDKAAASLIKEKGFKKKEDIAILTEQLEKYQTELAELNEQLSSAGGEVRKYKVLSDIYDKMTTKEDYISRLVREAKDRTTSEEWCNMIAEQRSIILSELDKNISYPMTVIEKKLREKLLKLRTMNVEPHETEQVIKALAVMRIDKIDSIETAHTLSGRMKISAANANDFTKRASFLRRSRDYDNLIEAVRNIDIYPPEPKKNPLKKKHRR